MRTRAALLIATLALGIGWAGPVVASPERGARTAESWVDELGPPTRSLEASESIRTDDEPLQLYWMQTEAAPLGLGPRLPGTLVADFDATSRALRSLTFLAMATPDETAELVGALRGAGWVTGATELERIGGTFVEYALRLNDGRIGTLAVRTTAVSEAGMADGRASPTLWIHLAPEASATP